jgi:integrase
MNFVEPIHSTKKIAQIKNLLRGQGRIRDLFLFVVGINTALRISDLLPLKMGHFVDEKGKTKQRFWIRERKRGKRHEVVINNSIRQTLGEYLQAYPGIIADREKQVFFSGHHPQRAVAIKRGQAYNFVSSICRDVGLTGNYGTHTLRKTWGYHARMQGVDLALIMHKLNHSSLAYTKRYLGITDDELEAVARRLNL